MSGLGDLSAKIENMLMDNLPHIKDLITEKVGSAARGAVDSEEICRLAAIKIFKFMPRQIRMTISEMEFADIFWKKRHAIFSKQRVDGARDSADSSKTVENEIIKDIYKKIDEQRVSLDEITNSLKILENRIGEKS